MAVASLTQRWVAQRLPARPPTAHKGSFGRLLVVAGSLEYAGAALLTGLGAARAGAGLVCLATPESVGTRQRGAVPELTALLLAEEAPGLISPGGWRRVTAEARSYDAVVVGPGLGRQTSTLRRTRTFISDLQVPGVVDADALNALAETDRWWQSTRGRLVLTPHPGEFTRLSRGRSGERLSDEDDPRAAAAGEAAVRWSQVVVLKGARTVIAAPDGALIRSAVATPALATAGSGDVLAGAIGAMLAGGLDPFIAAACGVAVHGVAGLMAEKQVGHAGVMASDVAALLPQAIEALRGGVGS
jgi:hydroxyethylthiazole kinase-like uncharacterized protein yjeF